MTNVAILIDGTSSKNQKEQITNLLQNLDRETTTIWNGVADSNDFLESIGFKHFNNVTFDQCKYLIISYKDAKRNGLWYKTYLQGKIEKQFTKIRILKDE